MLYSIFGRQSFAVSFVVALLAGLQMLFIPMASSQNSASGTLSVGAVVINSCNINRSVAAGLQRSPNNDRRLECWHPSNRQDNAVKPEVHLINEGEGQHRVLVVY
jgi:hypothetical protein